MTICELALKEGSLSCYNNTGICTIKNDDLFSRYEMDRKGLLSTLLLGSDIHANKIKEYISIDPYCQCRLGKCSGDPQRCYTCVNIQRITALDPKITEEGYDFLIECGRHVGKRLRVRKLINFDSKIKIKEISPPIFSPFKQIRYISMDKFSCGLSMSILLRRILSPYKLSDSIEQIYTGFQCGPNFYYLQESLIPIVHLVGNDKIEIAVKQLIILFDILKKYNITHGSLSLAFSPTSWSCSYEDIELIYPFTLKLVDLTESGVTYSTPNGDIRLFYRDPLTWMHTEMSVEARQIHKQREEVINSKDMSVYLNTRNIVGSPLFDFYALLLTLTLKYNGTPWWFFDMWLPEELETATTRLSARKEPIKILEGLTLRNDIFTLLKDKIR